MFNRLDSESVFRLKKNNNNIIVLWHCAAFWSDESPWLFVMAVLLGLMFIETEELGKNQMGDYGAVVKSMNASNCQIHLRLSAGKMSMIT